MMWSWDKSQYVSIAAALENRHGDILERNPELQHCLYTIRMAEARINEIMEKAEEE